MPTLAGLLGAVDSVVTPAKRKLADLLANPVDSWQQMQGGLLDDTRRLDSIYKTAGDGRRLDAQGSVMGGLPQYKQAQQQQLSGLLNVMPIGATVWHGSPHKFDKFDASKIGTGEGAQAYGHGIYTAETPDVAKSYMALGHMQGNVSKVGRKPINDVYSQLETAEQQLFGNRYIDQATKNARGRVISDQKAMLEDLMNNGLAPDVLKSARDNGYSPEAVKWFEKQVAPRYQPNGNLYKVDLPDEHIAKMLDWDKPLSQQQQLRGALDKFTAEYGLVEPKPNMSGKEYYQALENYTGATSAEGIKRNVSQDVSGLLKQYGIPGIRYLDQGSRNAGTGTSNFVVFPGNEGILSILERNGIPLK